MSATVAIIGGGPCGLTLARLLERKGVDYVVYERDEHRCSGSAGGSLDIHAETGQQSLREAGLLDSFKKLARYDDTSFVVADKNGNRLLEAGEGREAPEIDRLELRQLLLDSVPADKIRWAHKLTNVSLDGGLDGGLDGSSRKTPVLHWASGATTTGHKLVVGTDGAWSRVRPVITKAVPLYSGYSYIEGRIQPDSPHYETVANHFGRGSSLNIGSGKYIATQRQGDLSYRVYFAVPVPEDFFRNGTANLDDMEATRRLLLSTDFFADWPDHLYHGLIRYATDFRSWPLYSLSPETLKWQSVSGVTLAGDAAHVSVPNGEGVNCAMTDALRLAEKIAEHGSETEGLAEAVREYEAGMFVRGMDTITSGHAMAAVMFSDDPQAFLQLVSSWQDE